jgi:hypothetical protein
MQVASPSCMHSFEITRENITNAFHSVNLRVRRAVIDHSYRIHWREVFPHIMDYQWHDRLANVDLIVTRRSNVALFIQSLRPGGMLLHACNPACVSQSRQFIRNNTFCPSVNCQAFDDVVGAVEVIHTPEGTFRLIRRKTFVPGVFPVGFAVRRSSLPSLRYDYVSFATLGDHFDQCLSKVANIEDPLHSHFYTMSPLDYSCVFVNHAERNKTLVHRRGGGYWLWKSFVVWNALLTSQAEFVVYCDSCSRIKNISRVIDSLSPSAFVVAFRDVNLDRWFTKRDVFVHLNCDTPNITGTGQLTATAVILRTHDPRSFALVEEWFQLGSISQLITDAPSHHQNYPGFRDHRHDQSIWSVLLKRTMWTNATGVTEVDVNAELNHHEFG